MTDYENEIEPTILRVGLRGRREALEGRYFTGLGGGVNLRLLLRLLPVWDAVYDGIITLMPERVRVCLRVCARGRVCTRASVRACVRVCARFSV